jgi:hypothetical protein
MFRTPKVHGKNTFPTPVHGSSSTPAHGSSKKRRRQKTVENCDFQFWAKPRFPPPSTGYKYRNHLWRGVGRAMACVLAHLHSGPLYQGVVVHPITRNPPATPIGRLGVAAWGLLRPRKRGKS